MTLAFSFFCPARRLRDSFHPFLCHSHSCCPFLFSLFFSFFVSLPFPFSLHLPSSLPSLFFSFPFLLPSYSRGVTLTILLGEVQDLNDFVARQNLTMLSLFARNEMHRFTLTSRPFNNHALICFGSKRSAKLATKRMNVSKNIQRSHSVSSIRKLTHQQEAKLLFFYLLQNDLLRRRRLAKTLSKIKKRAWNE